MDGYIKITDFMLVLAIVLIAISIVVLSVFVILFIKNLNDSVKIFKGILEENRKNINDSLNRIPTITENVAEISETAKNELKSVESALKDFGVAAEYTVTAAKTVKNDIVDKFGGILEITRLLKKVLFKEKNQS